MLPKIVFGSFIRTEQLQIEILAFFQETLTDRAVIVDVIIPLNPYSFFEELEDKLLTPM